MERFFSALTRLVLAHRLLFGLGLLTIMIVAAAGLFRLEVAFSFQSFVGSRDSGVERLQQHIERWGSEDARLFIVVEDDRGLIAKDRLQELEQVLERLEASDDIHSATGLPRVPLLEPGSAVVGAQTIQQVVAGAADVESARARILQNASIVPLLLSRDGTATAILATLAVDADDITAFRPVVKRVRKLLDAEEERSGLKFKTAGIPAVRSEFVDQLLNDQALFMSIAMAAALLLLIFLFRSFHGIVVPIVAAIVPTVILFGLMGWTKEPVGILSQVYITLIPVIALADTLHVVTRFEQAARAAHPDGKLSPAQRMDVIAEAMGHTGAACLLTSMTTMIGFLSLYVADMQVLHSFGLYAGLGVGIAFLCLLVVLPIGLSFVSKVAVRDEDKEGRLDRALGDIGAFSVRHPGPILGATLLLCAGALALGSRVHVDNRLNDVLGEGHDVSAANQIVDDKLAGVVTIQIGLTAKEGTLLDDQMLERIDALEEQLRAIEDIRAVRGPASMLRTLNLAVLGEARLPSSTAEVAQVWLLVGEAAGANMLVTESLSKGRIIMHLGDLGGAKMEALSAVIEPAVRESFPADSRIEAHITGVNWVAYKSFNRLSRELLLSLLSAFGLICLLIALLFRSVTTALMSMVPNAVPLLLTLAVMGVMGWRLDPPSSVVFVVGLGIAVDDTIHILARFHEEAQRLRREGAAHVHIEAVKIATKRSGRAIAITTLLLTVAFGVNSLSSFPMNRVFGVLGGVAVFSALWCDVIVLPALIAVRARLRGET